MLATPEGGFFLVELAHLYGVGLSSPVDLFVCGKWFGERHLRN